MRGLFLALSAMGLAACEASADQSAAPAAAETSSLPNKPPVTPSLSPVATAAAPSTLTTQEAERAFMERVRAVAWSIGDIDGTREPALPDDVFAPLVSAGIVGRAFDFQYDYNAWSRPRRPLGFLGHQVMLVMAEDIRGPWIGCCVERGVTLYLRKARDDARLRQFAEETRCRLEPASENLYLDSLKSADQPLKDADNLIALSCHERDILDDRAR